MYKCSRPNAFFGIYILYIFISDISMDLQYGIVKKV